MIKVFFIQIVFILLFKVISSNSQRIGEKYVVGRDEDVLYYKDFMALVNESGLYSQCHNKNIVRRRFQKKITILIDVSHFLLVLIPQSCNGINVVYQGFVDKDLTIVKYEDKNLAYRVYRLLVIQDDFCVYFKDLNGYSPTYTYFFSFRALVIGGTQNRNIGNKGRGRGRGI
jgi:hypothetical protein